MPVYLFTFHAYRCWMPDRPRGYVRRDKGVLPADKEMAQQYERNAKHDQVVFDREIQQALINEVLIACKHQRLRLFAVTTEATHVHPLVSWRDERRWIKVRTSLKTSLSLRLKQMTKERQSFLSFSRAGSRKRVKDEAHLDYLMTSYLPGHPGAGWFDSTYLPLPRRPQ